MALVQSHVQGCMFIAARDTRREGMLVGGTNKKHMVTYQVDPREDALEVSQHASRFADESFTTSVWHMSLVAEASAAAVCRATVSRDVAVGPIGMSDPRNWKMVNPFERLTIFHACIACSHTITFAPVILSGKAPRQILCLCHLVGNRQVIESVP